MTEYVLPIIYVLSEGDGTEVACIVGATGRTVV